MEPLQNETHCNITEQMITCRLKDGELNIPIKAFNNLSNTTSVALCSDDIIACDKQDLVADCKLTKEELLSVISMLRGECSANKLSNDAHSFVNANLLLPDDLSDMEDIGVNTIRQIQDMHVALLLGKTKICLVMNDFRGFYFKETRMYANLPHIVPVQVSFNEGKLCMVSICEGVPIWTSEFRHIPIISENLYDARLNYNGTCRRVPTMGKRLDGPNVNKDKCTHKENDSQDDNGYPSNGLMCDGLERMGPICGGSYMLGECNGVMRLSRRSFEEINVNHPSKLLSMDPFTYIEYIHKQTNDIESYAYCSKHTPYYKHTATQAMANAVLKLLLTYRVPTGCRQLVSGYVNIKEYIDDK